MQIASLTSRHSTSWCADSCSSAIVFFSPSSSPSHAFPPALATQSNIPKTLGGCHVSMTKNRLPLPINWQGVWAQFNDVWPPPKPPNGQVSLPVFLLSPGVSASIIVMSSFSAIGSPATTHPTPHPDRLQYLALIPPSQYDAIYHHLFFWTIHTDDGGTKPAEREHCLYMQWLTGIGSDKLFSKNVNRQSSIFFMAVF